MTFVGGARPKNAAAVKNPSKRRGNVVMTALTLVPLLGFSSLSVDIGLQRMTNIELQSACDAAAMGGVEYLDGTSTGMDRAVEKALWLAGQNPVFGDFQLTERNIILGEYADGTFAPTSDPKRANAMKVQAKHLVGSILAGAAFGEESLPSAADATAAKAGSTGPASVMDCYLPFVIPDCLFEEMEGEVSDPMQFMFSNANSDNVGWGLPHKSVSASRINKHLKGTCDGTELEVGGFLYKDNGQKNSAVKTIKNIINGKGSVRDRSTAGPEEFAWPPRRDGRSANKVKDSDVTARRWGHTLEGPVALVDMGPNCNNLNFKREKVKITGFTYAYVYDVKSKGGKKNLWMQLDFKNEYDMGSVPDPDALGNLTAEGGVATMID